MHPLLLTSLDDSFSFGAPEWLWALLLLLPILGFFIQAGRKRSELLSKILAPRLQEQLAGRVSPLKRNLRLGLLLLSLALIIVALAEPRYGYAQQTIKSHGRDVIIAIDTSRSMLSTDTAPTRLGRAKLIAQDLLNLLKGDRVGVIAFAGTAFLQAPLTLDKGAVLTSINDLDTGTIPKGGTDIAAAIQMAIAAFGKGEGESKALVLMTDGEELDESGVEAAKAAAALGIRIFTIGFGSAEGSLIPIKTESGQNDFVRDENGNPVNSKLDASRLTEIAKETRGFYLPYGQDAAKMIYDKGIVPMEAQEMGTLTARQPIERYAWLTTAALILLSLWSILGEGRRKGAGVPAILVAGLGLMPLSLHASGLTDYNQGNYQGALKDFEHRLQTGNSSATVQFDAGAAAYKAGDYKKAAEYFSEAMTSTDAKIRSAATYNLANSLVRTGEGAKEDEAKLSDWKNSLQHYETVLKATPGNVQAKENRDIVKKLIEELKKQQEQKKQQDKKNDQSQKDQKDKKDQKKDQSKGDGKSDQQKNQDQNDQQKNDKSQKDQQKNPEDSKGSGGKDQQNQDQKNPGQQPTPTPQQENQKDQGSQPTPTPSPSPNPSATPDQGKGSDSQKQDQQSKDQQGDQKKEESQQPNQPKDSGNDQQKGQGSQPTPTPSPEEKKEGALSGGQQGPKPEEQQAAEAAAAGDESKDGGMSTNQARALLRSVQDEEQHVLNQQQHAVDQTLHDW